MYFHKDVGNLTLTESALLAGMIQSPNPYNPYRHPQRAIERRNQVLRAMREAGFIEEATAEAAIDAAPARGVAHAGQRRGAVLRGPREHAARAALRQQGPHHPEPLDLHLARPAPPGPGAAGPRDRASTNVEKMVKRKDAARRCRGASSSSSRRRGDRGPRGRALLRRQPVQPRHPGAAAARQHLQALRLPHRLRGHLRRPGAAAHHAGHGGGGHAGGLLLRGQGVHPPELRGRVPGERHAAARARPRA